MSDLDRIEALAGAMLRDLAPAARQRLLRRLGRDLARSQSGRIRAQRQPDGSAFAPRKAKPEPAAGAYPLRFLYPKGAAEPRLVRMKSWRREGPLLTGFDLEAGAIRSFFWDQVAQWLPVAPNDKGTGGRLRRRGAIRRRAMFRKLASGRNLRSGATDAELWVGFSGRASAVARVHQEGGMDRPAAKARPVRYARRELLGLSDADRTLLIDGALAQLARG